MEIRTFIGRKLNYINGILRVHIELSKPLKLHNNVKFTYVYYYPPKNPVDFFSKRYILYPFRSHYLLKNSNENTINNISFQYLGDLAHFIDKKKTIITCADIYNFLEKKNLKNPWIIQKYSLFGLKKCRYIMSISDFTKIELINKFKIPNDRITVIKCGINREMFKPLTQNELSEIEQLFPNHKKILHVGTEEGRKDFLTLVKAFYLVKKKIKRIKLIRIGTPSYSNVIKNLGLEKDVIYLSKISNERLREIYNLCDFFVFPSLYEGFGLPGLEAASCGTPVICSDIPIFKEIYKDFPLYFPPKDYIRLAKVILDNINEIDLKQELRRKGIQIAKLYPWEKSAKKYFKLLTLINEKN